MKRFPLSNFRLLAAFALAVLLLPLAVAAIPSPPDAPPDAPPPAQQNPVPTLTLTPQPTATLSPTPDAAATTAAAVFNVAEASVNSQYPAGMEYVFKGSSSAGEITSVQIVTRGVPYRYTVPRLASSRQPLAWDAGREAWVLFDRRFSPPWSESSYRFRAADSAGNILETEWVTVPYADNTRDWTRLEDDNVVVLLTGAPSGLAEELFASASNALDTLEAAFGFPLNYKPKVVIVPDVATLTEWMELPQPGILGQTFSGYTIQRLDYGRDDLVYGTVPHELAHIYQGYISEARDIPGWFIEGHATFFEVLPMYDYAANVREHLDRVPNLEADISRFDGQGVRWRYDVGYTFVLYWIQNYGMESHRMFWQAQVEMNFTEAVEYVTGIPFAELQQGWREWLGLSGPAPTLVPTPGFELNFPTPTFQAPG